jgi:PGF-pre-PGF domain-containing protein
MIRKLLIIIVLVFAVMPLSSSLITPSGISGSVLELDGVSHVKYPVRFSINNSRNGFFYSGLTGRGENAGRFVATVTGQNNDQIIIKAWNDYHVTKKSVVLQGVLFNVNLVLNTSVPASPPLILSKPLTVALEDSFYAYQVEAFDPDFDELSYSLLSSPAGMRINSSTGLISWQPAQADVGLNKVAVVVSDSIFFVNQSYDLVVQNVNDNPVITTTPKDLVHEHELYSYDVNASDEDGDFLTFILTLSPGAMSINRTTGLVSFVPQQHDVGAHNVTVVVEDGFGGMASQSFELIVENVNDKPVVTSSPSANAVAGSKYQYQVIAFDEDNDNISLSLVLGPVSMTLSEDGLVEWIPASDAVGSVNVSIMASDSNSSFIQNFSIIVQSINDALVVSSVPNTTAYEDRLYTYQVIAGGPDSGRLAYRLDESPQSMHIDNITGLISFMPSDVDIGLHNVTIIVSGSDGFAVQSYALAVFNTNDPPAIVSVPQVIAVEHVMYSYQVSALDPDNDSLVFSLQSSPEGMLIDVSSGLIVWTPGSSQVGVWQVNVSVSDGFLSGSQGYLLAVSNVNDAPVIVSSPVTSAIVGAKYYYGVDALDADNDSLAYSLLKSPKVMMIDQVSGLISWIPGPMQAGTHNVVVSVNDSNLAAVQSFYVVVEEVNICRKACLANSGSCLGSARSILKGCMGSASMSYESCLSACHSIECRSGCRRPYFALLKSCYENFRMMQFQCDDDHGICLDSCRQVTGVSSAPAQIIGNASSFYAVSLALTGAFQDSAKVIVENLPERPSDTQYLNSPVYAYANIDNLNIGDDMFNGANISFFVERSWLKKIGLLPESIVLSRYNNNRWQVLETRIVRSDSDRVYYVAQAPGFSYFAVSSLDGLASAEEYGVRDKIRGQVQVSGVLFAEDGRTQYPAGTRIVFRNLLTNSSFEATTGSGPYEGAFFVLIDAEPQDRLELELPGTAKSVIVSDGDIEFASFIVANKSIILERNDAGAFAGLAAGNVNLVDDIGRPGSAVLQKSVVLVAVVVACLLCLALYLIYKFRNGK